MEVLEFLTMDHLRNEHARALSGGQQKLLELGRLLMLDPEIIILDESFARVHPRLMEVIYRYIERVNGAGTAIILQRRRKNVPARRRKNVLRAGWELVPVVHGRDPRAGRRALRAAGGGPRVGGACGPTGPSGGLFGRLPAS